MLLQKGVLLVHHLGQEQLVLTQQTLHGLLVLGPSLLGARCGSAIIALTASLAIVVLSYLEG
jgi:hypothetical protein